jgi:hypothetical protein
MDAILQDLKNKIIFSDVVIRNYLQIPRGLVNCNSFFETPVTLCQQFEELTTKIFVTL